MAIVVTDPKFFKTTVAISPEALTGSERSDSDYRVISRNETSMPIAPNYIRQSIGLNEVLFQQQPSRRT